MNVALIIFAMLVLSVTDKIALKALGQPSSSYVVFLAMLVAYAVGWAVSEFSRNRSE
ncbi:hypothetical protein [Methylobacterium sp. Leaf106]|uniref:hypothetical protein n=1 Tax=Methylobacterium sp. Leaf106 TaxID=1736255 RepID=UPI0012E90BD1|nr:hypothetical protein [Methylobacterium sp. Leaf106]